MLTARRCAAISDERSLAVLRTRAAAMRAAAVPDWLAEVMRPKNAPVPWRDMAQAVIAICVPLATGSRRATTLGLLPAMGGLIGIADRPRRPVPVPGQAGQRGRGFGGAAGLTIGSPIHGRGWIAVVALVVIAGVSGILARSATSAR